MARANEVSQNTLYCWRRERSRAEEQQIAALERKMEQQALEMEFLPGCVQHAEEQRRLQALTTRGSSAHVWNASCDCLSPGARFTATEMEPHGSQALPLYCFVRVHLYARTL